MRNQCRLLRTFGLAVLFTLLVVGVASAHADLIKSDPAPGAVLATAPSEVRLWYDEQVDVHFSEVQVLDKNLQRVDKNDLQAIPGDPKQIFITLRPLSDGTYTVAWKAFSATDGHVTRGNLAFSVGSVAGPVIAPVAPVSGNVSETDPLSILVRGLNLLALLALTGIELFSVLFLERSLRTVRVATEAEAKVWSTSRGLSLAAFVLALLTTLMSLLFEASVVGNVSLINLASSDAVARTLLNTRFGVLWSARMILLLALGATILFRWEFARSVAVLLGLGMLLTVSEGGHSAAVGGEFSLALVSDWLHLAGVAIWVGGLLNFLAVMVVLWGQVDAEKRARWIAWMVPHFSAIALPTAFLIALTGLYSASLEIPTPNALVATEYGASLTIKVALFLVMVGLGAVNLLFVSPRFRRAVTSPERSAILFTRFRLIVGAEVLLGITAVFLAGLLTLESPARNSIEQPSAPNIASNPSSPQIAISAPPNAVQETPAPFTAPASAPAPVGTGSEGPIPGDLKADFGIGMLVIALLVGWVASGRKRVKRQRYLLFGLSVFAFLASIGIVIDAFAGAPANRGAIASATPTTSAQTQLKTIGDLVVAVNIQPRVYSPSEVELRLTDANGNPEQDIRRVDLETAMAGMTHGAVGITATREGPGFYSAHAMLFPMWGPSLMALRVERSDGKVQSSLIQIDVPPDVQTGSVPGMYKRPPGSTQTVDVAVYPRAILPRNVDVMANHPIRLEIMFVDDPPCGASVYLEQLNLETAVTAEGLAELSFTPKQNARYEFTCKPAGLEVSQSR